MKNDNQIEPESTSLYFDLQADFGITKHMGGLDATRELAELCHIQEGSYVLEVGCGIGVSACFLAKEYGCRIMAVDISDKMVARAAARAKKRGLESRLEFRVADAQQLPFEDDLFDAVIDESVMAFVGDKQKALSEYVRVLKPGGYIGLNEVTWVKPPEAGLVDYASFIMAGADFQTGDEWTALLAGSGVKELQARSHKLNILKQWIAEVQQLDLKEYSAAWSRFLSQSFSNPAYKKFTRQVLGSPQNIFKFMASIGYGVYVGRK